ncbi:ATP-binding cassette domain-containing protein [Amphibiibacter pelophylacis]|uniref:ATP-binding cassette domain-containing protein n=1 Tax=Amphibiibacter pelophylacis TaxID=1799477 RepID=A0ACC6NZ68_9BURK
MIQFRQLALRRGTKIIVQDLTLALAPNEKIALVGQNGAGKSSLFALLTGDLVPDQGDTLVPAHWRVAQVVQHLPDSEDSATDFVLDGDSRLVEARTALAQAEASGDGHAIAHAHALLQEADAFSARPRAQTLLLGLGFALDRLESPVNTFSGGWRMRLQLARALMCPSDLLLLDEPTNHLDLDALVWLEGWLQRYPGLLLVISHDRDFLNRTTRVTLHLQHQQITRYGGNYDFFEMQHAERLMQQQSAFERQQQQRAHLQHFIDRFKAKATKARQAQSRIKALERMQTLAPVLAQAEFQFAFRPPASLPNPMLALRGVDCGYPDPGRTATQPEFVPAEGDWAVSSAVVPPERERVPGAVLRNVTQSVLAGARLGILGANGQGKSTLIKTLVGELQPLAGELRPGKDLRIGYFAQHELDLLRADDTPLLHLTRIAQTATPGAREQELRDFLGRFRFSGDMVGQPIGVLSGGEKARLVLATLVWQSPNLLLLDEPTNHLDLDTREALSLALNGFEGGMLLVSHDRALLREVCDEFWLVSGGGVAPFDGDLDDYQAHLQEQARAQAARLREASQERDAATAAASGEAPAPNQRLSRKEEAALRQKLQAESRPHKKAIQDAEAAMTALQTEQQALEERLSQPGQSSSDLATWGRRLKDIAAELEAHELAWLEAQEALEALQQGQG